MNFEITFLFASAGLSYPLSNCDLKLANAVKKQTAYLQVKHTDREVTTNLSHLHSHISKTLQAFPNLKDRHPTALALLAEIEASVRKSTGEFTHPDGKSGV